MIKNKTIKTIKTIQHHLLNWYDQSARSLPWRSSNNVYAIWVSEIMLQQTQVDTVIPYYHRFLKAFPTVKRLAQATEDEVLKQWEGLGYYRRARALHQAAKIIIKDYKNHFPKSAEDWRTLPGIGRYTANAIASIAYQEPVAVLDGNVKRVIARLTCFTKPIDDKTNESPLWAMADQLLAATRPGDFNQAMMEIGALICKEKEPLCTSCPINQDCQAWQQKQVKQFPQRTKRKKVPHVHVVVGLIKNKQGCYLIGKRPSHVMLGGLWEFPGGKVKGKEALTSALNRELQEELSVAVTIGHELMVIKHAYTHFKITLHAYPCQLQAKQQIVANYHLVLKWIKPAEFSKYAFPGANKKLINLLKPAPKVLKSRQAKKSKC